MEELLPSKNTAKYWIYHGKGQDHTLNGKWMLFYTNDEIDEKWKIITKLYDEGLLPGITSMKVSTFKPNPRASNQNSKVIILYCGPCDDEELVKNIGQKIIDNTGYKNIGFGGYMYYKTDSQTILGTKATGQTKNWLYRLKT